MADDSAEFDAHAPTDLLTGSQVAESMTESLPTDLITDVVTSALYSDADAQTVSLVRQCPRCGLMFSAQYGRCPVDNERLESLAESLGGSLYEGSEPDSETEMFSPVEPRALREAELAILGVADDATIRGSVLDGRFLVEDLIGEGGMGRVYRGSQLSVGRVVAIKVLHARISDDQSVRERFNREARIVSAFSHPNTVRLIDFGDAQGHLYMVMEFVDGMSLQRYAGRGPMNVAFSLEVIRQVCGPLAEAHKSDVVHRDLKPENLFVTRTADSRLMVKLLDFGVAHIDPSATSEQADTYRELTRQGVVVGTPEYMAPEQARGETVTQSTDVYALGVILYQLLSGRLPFYGQTPMHTMFQLVTKPVPPITDHLPNCPMPLVELIESLLQKDVARRINNVVQVARRVREVHMQMGLTPLTDLPDGDLHTVLENLVFEDSALGPTDEHVSPGFRDTEHSPAPTPVMDVWQRSSERPRRVTEQQDIPQKNTMTSAKPVLDSRPTPEPDVQPLVAAAGSAADLEWDAMLGEGSSGVAEGLRERSDSRAITVPSPATELAVTERTPAVTTATAPMRTVKNIEPTDEINPGLRTEMVPPGGGALRTRQRADPTELRRPYVPGEVETLDTRSRPPSRFKIVVLAVIILGVTLALTAAVMQYIVKSSPPPEPADPQPPVQERPTKFVPSNPPIAPKVVPATNGSTDEPPPPDRVDPEKTAVTEPAVAPKAEPEPVPEKPKPAPKPEAERKPKPKAEPKRKPKAEPKPEPKPDAPVTEPEPVVEVPKPTIETPRPDDSEEKNAKQDDKKDEASTNNAPVEPDPPKTNGEEPAEPTIEIEGMDG